ncbi:uncharacterized protein LAESUDRAFT_733156 [Laetiporus sulphureus 93-53]|uniref:RRN7-type domain-containing protein n=1 Tax=Laetiporus sulphureus 93-53 TaxID=1314785 RepID=A0A165I1M4_9APHY|nr:uncharacterized protein LAESUDRAFT_733156 [Laetiporus sulphureus 93-53]KZT12475.1 hypothetical protein LAESUDRAFT_733156 [Laetiporus sulphureus 93-53]
MSSRNRCSVCGSKRWHKQPSSGLIFCREGHVLQNYRSENNEIEDWTGTHELRKRQITSQRERKDNLGQANSKPYHGERARFHYFQCLQLILRMQIVALKKAWHLPPEYEIVCRDTWALHLSLLPNPPPAEPFHYAQEERLANSRTQIASDGEMNPPKDANDGGGESSDQKHTEIEFETWEPPSFSSESSSEDEELEEDPVMKELMKENSVTPSHEDEFEDISRPRLSVKPAAKKVSQRSYDAPASNIAVLMVACWTLRLPVMYMDFIRLIETYELPYLEARRLLPASLTSHLTKHTAGALSPFHPPTPSKLHALTSKLAKLMFSRYSVYTPEMNALPMLWRAVRALCGTPTLYQLSKQMAKALSVPLVLNRPLFAHSANESHTERQWQKYDDAIKEVSLIAVVIVVLKLVYGLDGRERLPLERDDPACALPRLDEYLARVEEQNKNPNKDVPFSETTELSVLDMDDSTLDQFLDFCERALLPRENLSAGRNAEIDSFPLERRSTRMASEEASAQRSDLKPLRPTLISDDGMSLRPGQEIRIYKTQDAARPLPEQYETVIKRAAQWTGVPEDYVARLVENFERRLPRWRKTTERKEKGKGPSPVP